MSTVEQQPEAAPNPDADGIVGGGMDWFSDTLPNSKWRFRDGSVLSRADYSLLFSRIGTTYNTGGEAGTDFRLPNDTGRVTVGFDESDADFDTLGNTGGSKSALTAHTHGSGTLAGATHAHNYQLPGLIAVQLGATNVNAGNFGSTATDAFGVAISGSTASEGSGTDSMNPFVVIRPIIKVM